jgi:MoCo/4Fe-4S cofactor protein with predicted Tat translocation signal
MNQSANSTDVAALRRKLDGATGRQYWRSLEELADTDEFRSFLNAEFPSEASRLESAVDRRQFLKLMGASMALAGMSACTKQPPEKILPYAKQPEELVPGEPLYYASANVQGGFATGVLVESHMGRPTKIEGNPDHPASLGGTDAQTQATILALYDPDRAQTLTRAGEIRTWKEFSAAVTDLGTQLGGNRGDGLRILLPTFTSPTVEAQLAAIEARFPLARVHQWEAAGRDNARAGADLAFGEAVEARYDISKADVIVSLDADFLYRGPGASRFARQFAARRRPQGRMNRLYVAESDITATGSAADHRLALKPSELLAFARALAGELGLISRTPTENAEHARWAKAVAKDLGAHRGSGLVLAGDAQPAALHALAHAINDSLGNVGQTVTYTDPVEPRPTNQAASMAALVEDMKAGRVQALFMLGGNPVFDAPSDLGFGEALGQVPFTVHMASVANETSAQCLWLVPEAHYLETWGDARAFDGTVTVLQPLIEPLFKAHSAIEVLALLAGNAAPDAYELVRTRTRELTGEDDFENRWRRAVHDGVVAGTEAPARSVRIKAAWARALRQLEAGAGEFEVALRPDPNIGDGSMANNGWLQELPKPVTKLTWDNAVLMGPATARKLGAKEADIIRIAAGERSVEGPAFIVPGISEGTLVVHLGYGRRTAGQVGSGCGFDAYPLRTSAALWNLAGVEVTRTGATGWLATTQHHGSMEGRDLVRSGSISQWKEHPSLAPHGHGIDPNLSLYPGHPYDGNAWGMAIDLSACIGCNACEIACQAENNIAVVGKDQVSRGREMHWIRVDRYFTGDADNPEEIVNQPVPCMQCEQAPCEVVCPVNATSHTHEGLNDMVYNRCVGTRYCSNNCPYKVRRFNFYLYTDWVTETLKMQRNPDVTVRSRGVMEKCTYCVQRINYTRIAARRDGREIADGEIVTACQQACPSDAIVFGDINDPTSRVAKLKAEERNYGILAELGTRPRTTYLGRVRNPNPELTPESAGHGGAHHGDEEAHG